MRTGRVQRGRQDLAREQERALELLVRPAVLDAELVEAVDDGLSIGIALLPGHERSGQP